MKKTISLFFIIVCLLSPGVLIAQDTDLLKLVEDDKDKKEIVKNAFKSTRVISGQHGIFKARNNGYSDFAPVWSTGPGL
jgi:hypothetical protein